jgi:anti-sigma factor RsiW
MTRRWLPWRRRATDERSAATCREVVELVTDYVEETLPAQQRRRMKEHLDGCDGCVAYLVQMRRTVAVVASLREQELDPDFERRLHDGFRHWTHGDP